MYVDQGLASNSDTSASVAQVLELKEYTTTSRTKLLFYSKTLINDQGQEWWHMFLIKSGRIQKPGLHSEFQDLQGLLKEIMFQNLFILFIHSSIHSFIHLSIYVFQRQGFCVAQAVLEFTLQTRLDSKSEIHMLLPLECQN